MSFTAEQKSQLAKLLATENLTVQHQKISTAKFDTKNRVLYLPIWQNMTGVIYDLLVGHEVGHALYTPAEGWHDAVTDEDKNRNYKNFLNVIEDARIEKKVKRKYPGLNMSFKNAYQELNKRDFFGISNRDVNEMPFIDRLNLFSKSQWTSTWINFTAKEELLVKEVQAAETWDDVVRIADKVYEYSKEEQYEQKMEEYEANISNGYGDHDNFEDYETEEDDSTEDDSEEYDSQSSTDGEGDDETEDDSEENADSNKINHDKLSHPGDKDQYDPECQTDENYRKNETKLLDEQCKEFVYVDIPKPVLKNIITPAKRVQELMTKFYAAKIFEKEIPADLPTRLVNRFKNRNERYVGLLAKEFEMRKAAKSFSKSKLSDTGDIDINKLSSYKFDDNIFRKVMLTPKGKSHGLVLLLDRSGSMSGNMAGSIEQILVLSMFCRKVNIPFVVYGFTESADTRMMDLGIEARADVMKFVNEYDRGINGCFSKNFGELRLSNVHLREYLNSQMTNAEFSNATKNMCMLIESYKKEGRYFPKPDTEQLHNTPTIEAIVATAEIIKDFKRKNNLDICSLVLVQDGDADGIHQYIGEGETIENDQIVKVKRGLGMEYHSKVYIMRDRSNKFEYKLSSSGFYDSMSVGFLEWFRKVTDARIFGFFIVPQGGGNMKYSITNRYLFEGNKTCQDLQREIGYNAILEKIKDKIKEFKSEKFLASKLPGYDNFFLIHGGSELTTEDENFQVEGNFSARKLATAFAKYNKKRAVNRVLVSRFIQGIAA